MRGVPAVCKAHGFDLATAQGPARQAIVLHVVRQKDLALRMQREARPGKQARDPGDQGRKAKGGGADGKVAGIGVQAGAAGAERAFGPGAFAVAADPGAAGEAVEAFALARGVGVVLGRYGPVVDEPVGAGMLAEKERGVDGGPKPEKRALGAVDQLMRGGVGDLAKPEAAGEEDKHLLPGGQAAFPGDGPGGQRQDKKRRQAHGDQKRVGCRKLAILGRAGGQGDKLVQEQRQDAHVKEGRPEPGAALRHAKRQKRHRKKRSQGKGDKGQGAGLHRGRGPVKAEKDIWGTPMPDKLGETLALATAMMSLAAAVAYWLGFAAREVKGTAGAAVKTASTALLAGLALAMPIGGWFWLIPLGLALGALGDLLLALGGVRRFLAGVAAFGLGHLAYAGGLVWRAGELRFDGLSGADLAALGLLLMLLLSTEVWLAPRTGDLRQPVRGYVGLIGLLGLTAVLLPMHPGQGVLRLGAALFLLSDLMLALQLFVVRGDGVKRKLALALWPAYWLGQALILWGAVLYAGPA